MRDKKRHGKLVAIRVPAGAPNVERLFAVDDTLRLSEEMPYNALRKAVTKSSAHVRPGYKLVNKGSPFAKLTLTPREGGGGFAVLFSM